MDQNIIEFVVLSDKLTLFFVIKLIILDFKPYKLYFFFNIGCIVQITILCYFQNFPIKYDFLDKDGIHLVFFFNTNIFGFLNVVFSIKYLISFIIVLV